MSQQEVQRPELRRRQEIYDKLSSLRRREIEVAGAFVGQYHENSSVLPSAVIAGLEESFWMGRDVATAWAGEFYPLFTSDQRRDHWIFEEKAIQFFDRVLRLTDIDATQVHADYREAIEQNFPQLDGIRTDLEYHVQHKKGDREDEERILGKLKAELPASLADFHKGHAYRFGVFSKLAHTHGLTAVASFLRGYQLDMLHTQDMASLTRQSGGSVIGHMIDGAYFPEDEAEKEQFVNQLLKFREKQLSLGRDQIIFEMTYRRLQDPQKMPPLIFLYRHLNADELGMDMVWEPNALESFLYLKGYAVVSNPDDTVVDEFLQNYGQFDAEAEAMCRYFLGKNQIEKASSIWSGIGDPMRSIGVYQEIFNHGLKSGDPRLVGQQIYTMAFMRWQENFVEAHTALIDPQPDILEAVFRLPDGIKNKVTGNLFLDKFYEDVYAYAAMLSADHPLRILVAQDLMTQQSMISWYERRVQKLATTSIGVSDAVCRAFGQESEVTSGSIDMPETRQDVSKDIARTSSYADALRRVLYWQHLNKDTL